MLVYSYKNRLIRCFLEDEIYYFSLADLSKDFCVSRAYLSRISNLYNGKKKIIEGDKDELIYIDLQKINGNFGEYTFLNYLQEFYKEFDSKNLKEVSKIKRSKQSTINLRKFDVDGFFKECILQKNDEFYFKTNKFYKYLRLSSAWHEKRLKDHNLIHSTINYKDLRKFFEHPITYYNRYLECLRNYCLYHENFNIDELRQKFLEYINNAKKDIF